MAPASPSQITLHRRPSNLVSSPVTATHLNGVNRRPSGVNGHREDDDEGLVMRDREREKENHENSVGKAGGVGVGVTKPKRRLSSLPSLPHPFLSAPYRVSNTATPPGSPNGITHPHPHSVYQHMNGYMSGSGSSPNHYQPVYRPMPPKMDEKQSTSGAKDSPRFFGVELKWISLITLALQNAFLTIIMHYSRISMAPRKTYSAASAVLLNELLKGTISLFIALKRIDNDMLASPPVLSEKDTKDSDKRPTTSYTSMFHPTRLRSLVKSVLSPDCFKLAIPAILYVIQNNLQYVAASNLDVATFQVTYQMKILTTAFFSVLLLRKRLTKAKWLALLMLAVGVGIVQIQSSTSTTSAIPAPIHEGVKVQKGNAALRSEIPILELDESRPRIMHPFTGFLAVTLACMTSGLAGVYFELILKSSNGSTPPPDLWVRNTQLSLFSLIPALLPVIFAPAGNDGAGWLERVMASFANFNGWAIGTVLTQTFGGLITAIVIRYSDNIMKGFATSLSIIISFLASVALFSYPITIAFLLGSSIVLLATYLYNAPSSHDTSPPPRTAVAVEPGSPIPQSAPILGEPSKPSRTSSVISLLGLVAGTGSAGTGVNGPASRQPSSNDLRNQFGFSLGPPGAGMSTIPAFYSASAPGTPYLSSAYPSSSNIQEGRASPNLSWAGSATAASGGVSGVGLAAGRRGKDNNSPAASDRSNRPSLSLDTGGNGITGKVEGVTQLVN